MNTNANTYQCRVWLTLAAGTNYDYLLVLHIRHAGDRHKSAFRNLHEAISNSHFHSANHATPVQSDFFTMMNCSINYHLYTINVSRENSHEDAARRVVHNVDEAFFDLAFRQCPTDSFSRS